MGKKTPLPDQKKLDYKDRRGRELEALKRLRLGDPLCRLLLFVIDTYINHETQYWDLFHDELMEACELPRSTYYDRIKKLRDLHLISVEDLANTDKKRFRIIRTNVSDYYWHQGQNSTKAEPKKRRRRRKNSKSVHEIDRSVHHIDTSVREIDKTVHHMDCTILPTQYRPPTAIKGEAGAEVIQELIALKIDHPVPAVEAALKRGARVPELLEIIQHWRSLQAANGWGVAALQRRISNHAPGVPLQSGWPAPKPGSNATKAAPVCANRAARLDRMPAEELTQLIHESGNGTLISMLIQMGIDAVRRSDTPRRLIIKAIEQRELACTQ